MAKYSKKANKTVESAMRRKKKGTLTSGRSGRKVKSRKQAIAIGISEAREKGQKVPSKKGARKKAGRKKSASKKSSPRKSATKKKSSRKSSGRKSTGRKTAKKKSSR
jgi:hypothetical protein